MLTAPNDVQAILLVKLLRYVRPPVPAGGPAALPHIVGDHTFDDPGFIGDAAPGALETTPVSELVFVLMRRTAPPVIVRSGLGVPPPVYAAPSKDDVNVWFPGIAVGGLSLC